MDRYTKTVLTVIAVALAVIAFRMGAPGDATAQGVGCGESISRPCYVTSTTKFDDDLMVRISNWPSSVKIDNWPSSLR